MNTTNLTWSMLGTSTQVAVHQGHTFYVLRPTKTSKWAVHVTKAGQRVASARGFTTKAEARRTAQDIAAVL